MSIRRQIWILGIVNVMVPISMLFLDRSSSLYKPFLAAISVHQAALSLLASYYLGKQINQDTRPSRLLSLALIPLAIADLSYGIRVWFLGLPSLGGPDSLIHEVPYSLFACLAGAASIARARTNAHRWERNLILAACLLLGSVFYYASLRFIILPFYNDGIRHWLPFYFSCQTYALGESLLFGGATIAGLRSRSTREFGLWTSLSLLIGVDFVLRYSDAQGLPSGLKLFDIGWHISLVGILVASFASSPTPSASNGLQPWKSPAGLTSIRVMATSVLISVLMAALAVMLLLVPTVDSIQISRISAAIIGALCIGTISNLLSIGLSRILDTKVTLLCEQIQKQHNPTVAPNLSEGAEEFSRLGGTIMTLHSRVNDHYRSRLALEADLLREAMTAKVSAQVAHDIKAPLAALRVVSESLKDATPGIRDLLDSVTSRIADLSADLGATPGLTSDNRSPLQPTNLIPLIEEVVQEKQAVLGNSSRIRIHSDLNELAFVPTAIIRKGEFTRSLSNIFNNSIEAMPDGGGIFIDATAQGEFLELSIRDQGIGMNNGLVKLLHSTRATAGKESGLGLGIEYVRERTRSWGGELFLRSTPGEGTTVTLRLLADQASERVFHLHEH